jgi:sec-independent protein translocase protein TatA
MVGDILQPTHLLFVLVVALLVLGPKRLPEVGRTLGNGIRDFRSAINGESSDSRDEIESKPWHSDPEPEPKHEFAHDGETTPENHEFAHAAPAVSPTAPETPETVAPPTPAPASAAPAPAAQLVDAQRVEAPAQPVTAPAQPAATSDTAAAPDKHEFAYESSEAAENSAGPRT